VDRIVGIRERRKSMFDDECRETAQLIGSRDGQPRAGFDDARQPPHERPWVLHLLDGFERDDEIGDVGVYR
jgi:hypothetical protein